MRKVKLIKILFPVFICSFSFLSAPMGVMAFDKTQTLNDLQSLVKNPERAREQRRKINNSSKEELKKYDEVREIIKKEINTMSSSLPMNVDRYTTMYSAGISGNNIAFRYTLSNSMPGIKHKDEFMSEMAAMLKNNMCTSPAGAYLILGYIWSYYYFYEDGAYVGGVIVDAKTCGFE